MCNNTKTKTHTNTDTYYLLLVRIYVCSIYYIKINIACIFLILNIA